MLEISEEQLLAIIHGIYVGEIDQYDLPESLYYAIADFLKKGVYEGYKGSLNSFDPKSTDFELLSELRDNIYMFSAAKTYQQVKEMSEALVDEQGEIRNWRDFKEQADGIFDQYNENWLSAEYDTAIGQAQNASRWNEIEKNKDVLSILKYSAVEDENTCEICGPLDGLTAPVDDPVWDEIYPENHFRCRCTVEQHDEYSGLEMTPDEQKEKMVDQVTEKMNPVFIGNAGKERVVFNEDHPYFNVPKDDKGYAGNNFNLPIPKKDD